ncbi:hypothetical protein QTJ16_004982 [Diplocarpon rosae]|uniref:Uncharacterized protein n=1 Tax=Diplocarpon rosae TaxID=946125 RepID=A0AAD9SZS0_9HELO|nr:hypothetical protein QTJ16_004982 [Diplocarpon rosae]
MKCIVFDGGLFMATYHVGAIRVRSLDLLLILFSRKDLPDTPFSTHSPARRPRLIGAGLGSVAFGLDTR